MENEKQEKLKPFANSKGVSIENVYYISTKDKENLQKVFLKDVIDMDKNTWVTGNNIIMSLVIDVLLTVN